MGEKVDEENKKLDFDKTKENERKLLIKGYHYCIEYIDEQIKQAIDNGIYRVSLSVFALQLTLISNDTGRINNDTIQAVIYHYKKQGVKAYIHFEEGYGGVNIRKFPEEELIIDWSNV
ncbi:MAG: hypothetical protein QP798_10240 [Staphylococcus simulans]|uniref:hypothetical protein n=1 Tax=Staphylococcus TaxID=1279 RepID=UPI0008A92E4E|nr:MULTISPECIES: hypothetical protein [Staphylococcus]MDK7927647.1 hypothetical protein [Staphylococcus simulans]MDK8316313.1 hypothetical protein [Staphylococcus simulans]OHR48128.1 hypothetical protein HMPREF2951_11745 [Staphylococcus sp. HMSC056D08]OHS49070.1 hypothetical protein HMPREF3270_10160 [Staphylococcus sp. HMSC65H10]